MPYYAVHQGKINSVFTSWNDCKESINGYSGAIYKKFNNRNDAENFVKYGNNGNSKNEEKKLMNKNNHEHIKINIKKINKKEFIPDIYVYTDGACSKNGSSNARAGLGVYFGENDPRNLAKPIEGKQTNNVAEISAIIETYHILENEIKNGDQIMIYTDSRYSIKCCTTYGEKCAKNGWKDNIPNKELVKKAYNLFKDLDNVQFKHIPAHTGKTDCHSVGNFHADRLANEAIGVFQNEIQNKKKNIKPSERIYLEVAYKDKDFAKVCGARWDTFKKKWYITDKLDERNKEMIFKHFNKV